MSSKSVYPSPEQAIAAEMASKLAASRPTVLTELESVKQELAQLREAVEGAEDCMCSDCNGDGVWHLEPCGYCNGHGNFKMVPAPKSADAVEVSRD